MVFDLNAPDEFDRATLILPDNSKHEADGHLQIANGAWRLLFDDPDLPVHAGMYADVVLGNYAASCEVFNVDQDDNGTEADIKL